MKNFSSPENTLFFQGPEPVSVGDSHRKSRCRAGLAGLAWGVSLWVSGAQSSSSAPARHSLSCPSSRTQPSNQRTRVLLRGHAALRALQEILFLLRASHPSPIPAQTDL